MIAGSPKQMFGRPFVLRWRTCCNGYSCSGMSAYPRRFNLLITRSVLLRCLLSLVLAVFVFGTGEAKAAEGDGKEAGNLYVKIEPFTVNLHDLKRFLQVTMTLKVSNPLRVKSIKSNMPIILNELIYLLSDKDARQFESSDGKWKMTQQTREIINQALSLTAKDGVTEVFLESLIIQ